MFLGENRADGLEQIVLFPGFQNDRRPLFARRSLKFSTGILGGDGVVQFTLDRQIKPFLRPLFHLESHARREAQHAQ